MLSSLILSLAMSASPAPVMDAKQFDITETGRNLKGVRINESKLNIEKTGRNLKGVRINESKLNIEKTGRNLKGVRI